MNARRDRAERELLALMKKAGDLEAQGLDCLFPAAPACCPCKHQGSDFIMIDGKPAACSCGQCPRWKCLGCTKDGKNALCTVMTQMAIIEETA